MRGSTVWLSDVRRLGDYIAERLAPDGDCWMWTGTIKRNGYGVAHVGGKSPSAHRLSFEFYRTEIPEGLHLDHLCQNKACVNPWHLEPVSLRENSRRWSATITHCPKGHEYTPGNTRQHKKGGRCCRACAKRSPC